MQSRSATRSASSTSAPGRGPTSRSGARSWRSSRRSSCSSSARAGAAPAVRAVAADLPVVAGWADVAMAILTVHHWSDWRARPGRAVPAGVPTGRVRHRLRGPLEVLAAPGVPTRGPGAHAAVRAGGRGDRRGDRCHDLDRHARLPRPAGRGARAPTGAGPSSISTTGSGRTTRALRWRTRKRRLAGLHGWRPTWRAAPGTSATPI